MNLEQKIEAILFYKNEPVRKDWLASVLEVGEAEVRGAIQNLSASLEGRGISLIDNKIEISLTTSLETKELIEKIAKDEMSRDIGKAGLETLAIILYNDGATRKEVDYIRGVNSYFVVRSLSTRGLIEKYVDEGTKSIKYRATTELLAHLGLQNLAELPSLTDFKANISKILTNTDGEN
jgi:segregation and condensation protein B